MAKTRSKKVRPLKAFENANAIVLLVDADFVIRFANLACCKWVDVAEETLVGLTCVYSSAELENPLKNRVKGLCPPPEVFEGIAHLGSIFRTDTKGNKLWKTAVFTLLHDQDEDLALIVATGDDLKTPPMPGETNQTFVEQLHDALAAIRTRDHRLHTLDSLVGNSPHAIRIRRQVIAAFENNADVLIVGPTGAGREHLARTIFAQRKSGNSNLVPIQCAIADSQLIQQTIKQCVAEQNDRRSSDCLLLLGVDRLGEAEQNELLGFSQLPGFNLRTFSTANRPLVELATTGKFSMELAHYLSTQVVEMVALSDRREDIPPLAQALVEQENARQQRQISGLAPPVVELLVEYTWPRNIDELREAIEHAVAQAKSPIIQPLDLPRRILLGIEAARVGLAPVIEINLDEYLKEIESELISRAMRQAKDNKTKAANLLGLNRARLARRLEHLGLTEKEVDESDSNIVDASAFEETD